MVSIGINTDYDIETSVNDKGIRTIELSCGHEAAGNLGILRLITELDVEFFLNNKNVDPAIFAQQVRFTLERTQGIASADTTGIALTTNGRDISYGDVCFTTDCSVTCNYQLNCESNI